MIPGLDGDVDNKVVEDVMYKEVGPFEVKEIPSVHQRL